ncbi:MAG: hypothetical protein GX802_02320 [Clostridiales bacterium]|nr:hypothetical protein [Clostridiales bacterium]
MGIKKTITTIIVFILLSAVAAYLVFGVDWNVYAPTVDVKINEVMSNNTGILAGADGGYHDWVELHNAGSEEADISGFGLSDSLFDGVKYVFPKDTKIAPNGYLIVFCSGDTTLSGLNAGFRLSSNEQVVLFNSGGKDLDSIQLKPVEKGNTLAREGNNWTEMLPSPGFENSEAGIQAFNEWAKAQEPQDVIPTVVINELMASNLSTIMDKNKQFSDWVELYNITDKEIDLSGYGISDDLARPKKYIIPNGVKIPAKGYLLIFCSGEEGLIDGELHVPFSLRAYEEAVLLSNTDGVVIDSVKFSRLGADVSYARAVDGTGEFENSNTPTPGFPNTQEGFEQFSQLSFFPSTGLYISEISGSNNTHLAVNSQFHDWIELYNNTGETINLGGYSLSDSANNPAKWVFPNVEIKHGEYYTLLAVSPKKDVPETNYLVASFGISSEGEYVFLFDTQGNCIDKLGAKHFYTDMSVGRDSSMQIRYYENATPNAKNGDDGYIGLLCAPSFETTPGIYSDTIEVKLDVTEGETLYYTTDATTPTVNSQKYTAPITVNKNTVVRVLAHKDGYFCKFATNSGTFLFTTDGANHSLPVMALSTDPKNLFDGKTGMYAYGDSFDPSADTWPYWQKPTNFRQDWERPASFEVFNNDGAQVFQQNIGIKITGSFGRGREQKGLAVYARDEYGSSRMKYRFFEDLPFNEYKSLVLRCGAQDQANGKLRDEFSMAVLKGYDVNFLYQDFKPYILYINGEYWGVYFMREKRNRFFVAQHENTNNTTDMDLIKSHTRANYGTVDDWAALRQYILSHDLTIQENYDYVAANIDMDSFIDYMICEIYVANTDYWNCQMYRLYEDGAKWRFIYYDFCWGWDYSQHKTLTARRQSAQPYSDLFNALLKRNDFRDAFIRRFAELMKTVFEPNRILTILEEMDGYVSPEIERERSIFNSASSPYFDYVDPKNYSTFDRYQKGIDYIKSFIKDRPAIVKQQIQEEFNLSDEYMAEVFGNG